MKLKRWRLDGTIQTFCGFNAWICSIIELESDVIAIASNDGTVRIWKLSSETCLRTLVLRLNIAVLSLQKLNDRLFVSGSEDRTMRVWDSKTGDCIQVIETKRQVMVMTRRSDGSIVTSDGGNVEIRRLYYFHRFLYLRQQH